jgi:hypothetical protein
MRARHVVYGMVLMALLVIVVVFIVFLLWSGCGIWRIPC